jgi:enoyl-CoA hydratase
MELKNIILEKEGGIATVILNRPKNLNALNREVLGELGQAIDDVRNDDQVGVMLITGAGNRAFVAGADIPAFLEMDKGSLKEFVEKGKALFDSIEGFPKPVIAGINGFALGGGLELAMACHIRIASENAVFGLPEVSLGLIPGFAGTQRLPRIVGMGKALEMLLTGDQIGAEEALRSGLVNRVVPLGDLRETCMDIAKRIMLKAPLAVKYALESARRGFEKPFEEACRIETEMLLKAFDTEDVKEGLRSFVERRKPSFKGM